MIEIRKFISEVESVRKQVARHRPKQLRSKNVKRNIANLVDVYFRELRPSLPKLARFNIDEVDSEFQLLLELTHKSGAAQTYYRYLTFIMSRLAVLDGAMLAAPTEEMSSEDDVLIISTLRKIVPGAASSYEQALIDLRDNSRLSWRGPATDLREALRETLDYLAPDKEVEAISGYKTEDGAHGPTMKQKVRFILRSRGVGKGRSDSTELAVTGVDEIVGGFVRSVYQRSSISTHTPTEKSEVIRIRNFVRLALIELLT